MTTESVTVTATDIRKRPVRENDTELSVTVMRSCAFLTIRHRGRAIAHLDISREDWQRLASAPAPIDDESMPDLI